jgi:hypothetical protein
MTMLSSFGVFRLAAREASAFHSPPRRHDAEPLGLWFDPAAPCSQRTLMDHVNHAAVSRSLAKSHLTNMKPRPGTLLVSKINLNPHERRLPINPSIRHPLLLSRPGTCHVTTCTPKITNVYGPWHDVTTPAPWAHPLLILVPIIRPLSTVKHL